MTICRIITLRTRMTEELEEMLNRVENGKIAENNKTTNRTLPAHGDQGKSNNGETGGEKEGEKHKGK